jgi:spore coat protein I
VEDRSQEVLGKYELRIYNTYRTRGAYVLETDQGLKLLCGYEGSENRLEFEDSLKQQVCEKGYGNVDTFIRNALGEIVTTNSVGDKYLIKEWFDGEECSLKKEDKILLAVSNLAQLHNCLSEITASAQLMKLYVQNDLVTTLEKRTRELKRVKSYIRERKQKNEFELCYLSVCEDFYQNALTAMDLLTRVSYAEMLQKSVQQGKVCHGSYTYHNIFLLDEQINASMCKAAELTSQVMIATTNFEKAEFGLQIHDLYYFIRKTMEKNDWNLELGEKMIKEYKTLHGLSQEEQNLLYILLLYPEKFWKVTNYYYNSKKSWIPQKNVQKLQILSQQAENKKKFLAKLFNIE